MSQRSPSGGRRPSRSRPFGHLGRTERTLRTVQDQVERIRAALRAGESARLRVLAGELAAAARGSGDGALDETASELEAMLLAEEAETAALCEKIEALIALCKQ